MSEHPGLSVLLAEDLAGCQIGPLGSRFPENMEAEDWKALWPALRLLPGCLNWMIGDWLAFGRRKYGEKYADALEITSWEYNRLAHLAYVSSHVPFAVRNPKLDWSHHVEVAPLPEEDQCRYLQEAKENEWTVSQLRIAIRRSQATRKRSNAKVLGFVLAAWVSAGMRWLRQQDFDDWSKDRKAILRAQLRPIVDIYESLLTPP